MLISAFLMGSVGLFVTALQSLNTFTIVLLRGIFGTVFLTLFMFKTKSFSKEFIKSSFNNNWKYLLLIGILNPIVIYVYFVNIKLSGYAIAAFLLYTNGIFVLVLLYIAKIENITKASLISFGISICGVAIMMEFWNGYVLSWNILLGLFSGLLLGALIFGKKKIYINRDKFENDIPKQGNFDLFLAWWPTLFIIILFLPISGGSLITLSIENLFLAILMGLFPTALAFTLYNIGVKRDRGGNIVIIAYFEPLVATINNFFFLNQLSSFVIIGGLFIVGANIILLKYSSDKSLKSN
ncbi:MAG: DMT family transporter [Promethearchaeota archaeon]